MSDKKCPISPEAVFSDAFKEWIDIHSRYISARSVTSYREFFKPLSFIFSATPLKNITIHEVRKYQTWRASPHPEIYGISENSKEYVKRRAKGAGNAKINQEINALGQVLREAGLWSDIEQFYTPLRISREGSGASLTPEEEKILLDVAFSRKRWIFAAHCLRLMLRTGCGFGELSHRRLRDIDINAATMNITHEGAKNLYRQRLIPLIPEALESVRWLVDRCERLGGTSDCFLLPMIYGNRGKIDFARPMTSIKKAWDGIRKAAAKRIGPKMLKFRIYDCRVTAITRTLSDGKTPLHAAQRVFGHVSQEMQKRYFKPDADVLRRTLSVLDTTPEQSPETSQTEHASPDKSAVYAAVVKIDDAIGKAAVRLAKTLSAAGFDPSSIADVIAETFGKKAL